MNLNKQDIQELNALLKDKSIDVPFFRREVSPCGANFSWLQKHIRRNNPALPARLLELLAIS